MRPSILAVLALAGCSQFAMTALPDPPTAPPNVLSSAEQQQAIKDMIAKKDRHQAEALDQITKAK